MADAQDLIDDDLVRAMKEMNTVVDAATEDLVTLYHLACKYADIRHTETALVAEIMTREVTAIGPDQTLAEAAKQFLLKNVRAMPVVDDGNRVLGMLAEADLLAAIGLPCDGPAGSLWHKLRRIFSHSRHVHGLGGRVSEAMFVGPATVRVDDSLHQAIGAMRKKRLESLAVIDAEGRLCGIVSHSNVVRAFVQAGVGMSDAAVN